MCQPREEETWEGLQGGEPSADGQDGKGETAEI